MLYLKKGKVIAALILTVMTLTSFIACTITYADSQTKYYYHYKNTEENEINIEIGQQEVIYENIADEDSLDNLKIFPQNLNVFQQFTAENSDADTLINKLREYLLYYGYAKLIDSDIAPKNEIKAQKYAKSENLGIWKQKESSDSDTTDDPKEQEKNSDKKSWDQFLKEKLLPFWRENYQFILTCIFGCGILAALVSAIIKALRTTKKYLFLGGANSAGKSTMMLYLLNPDASTEDLLNQSPTLNVKKDRLIRDDTNRKMTLKAKMLDPPGHELQCAFDALALTLRDRIIKRKYIVLIVVAPTKSYEKRNDVDMDYIKEQLQVISILWSAIIKSKKTVKPQSVILFISKRDLFDQKDTVADLFAEHNAYLDKICKESGISFTCISGSVIDKAGMTDLITILKKRR